MKFLVNGFNVLFRIVAEIFFSLYDESEKFLKDADGIISLSKRIFFALPKTYSRRKEILEEMFHLGYESALIVIISIGFLGTIMVLETSYHISLVISDLTMLPGVVSRFAILEAGSTVTALIVICRICPGITSELALMKETEQLDAYKMMNVDIIEYLVLPKVVAVFLTLLALSVVATFTAVMAGWITCFTHIDMGWSHILHSFDIFVSPKDFLSPFIRVVVYACVIPVVASFYGLNSKSGATEIGSSATRSIVSSGVLIITLDLIITWAVDFIYFA